MLHVDLEISIHAHGPRRMRADVPRGRILALFGPSGGGKTTLLRALAGFHPARGTLSWDGRDILSEPVEARPFAWMPQAPSLFPHWTLRRQLVEARPARTADARLDALVTTLGLQELLERPGRGLSGGQQQRGELARALARDPDVLLLDEPFSALDAPTRGMVGTWLRELLRSEGRSMVMASHDWSDVESWADEVILLDEGQTVAQGDPGTLFSSPPNWPAARLMGFERQIGPRALHPDLAEWAAPHRCPVVLIGVVSDVSPHGAGHRVTLTCDDGTTVRASVPRGTTRPMMDSRVEIGFHAPEVEVMNGPRNPPAAPGSRSQSF